MRRSPPRLAFGLDGAGIAAFLLLLVVLASRPPDTVAHPGRGFFADPLAATLALLAVAAFLAGGAVAIRALARDPLRTRAGRWAVRLAVAYVAFLPVAGLLSITLDLEQGWGQPFVPAWLATGLGAVVLGALAREPRRRGLLLVPALVGVTVLLFLLGEILVPH